MILPFSHFCENPSLQSLSSLKISPFQQKALNLLLHNFDDETTAVFTSFYKHCHIRAGNICSRQYF